MFTSILFLLYLYIIFIEHINMRNTPRRAKAGKAAIVRHHRRPFTRLYSKLDRFFTKRLIISYIISLILNILTFAIIILRAGYPYHRHIAVLIFIVSWAVFVIPLLHHTYLKRVDFTRYRFIKKHHFFIFWFVMFLLILYTLLTLFPVKSLALAKADAQALETELLEDTAYLQDTIASLDKNYETLIGSGLLNMQINDYSPEKSEELKQKFSKIVDHIIVLDHMIDKYNQFYQINYFEHPELNTRAFLIAYTAFMSRHQAIHGIAVEIGDNRFAEGLLDEEMVGLESLEEGVYSKMKLKAYSQKTIARMNAGWLYLKFIDSKHNLPQDLKSFAAYDLKIYYSMFGSLDDAAIVSFDILLDNVEMNTMDNWLPVQKKFANALGDTKLTKRHYYFISDEQISKLYDVMKPGDIMVQRRNWYASNVGMPGFWTHAGIYVGTLEKLDTYFAEEAEKMFGMNVSEYIKENYPKVYEDKIKLYDYEGKLGEENSQSPENNNNDNNDNNK